MSVKQYTINCRVEYNATVVVDADTPEEALARFSDMDWADDGHNGAELVNFSATGKPRES
jgi:hypothetical protein